ncbi:glycosyltransferase family 4 protein [bacterium]|nr:glycosyltransferase family 4 protein [bacterium]
MNIVQVVNIRWWNAIAEYGISLAKGLHKRKHRVFVIGEKNTPPVIKAEGWGIPTYTHFNLNKPWCFLSDFFRLKEFLKKEKIQIINAHYGEGFFTLALAIKSLQAENSNFKIGLVRTRGEMRPPKNNWFNRIIHQKIADKLIVSSDFVKNLSVNSLHLEEKKIDTVYPFVDIEKFRLDNKQEKLRKKLHVEEKTTLVGVIGRLDPVKGHQIFIEAAGKISAKNSKVKFLIVGEEKNLKIKDLEQIAEKSGVRNKIIFVGFCANVSDVMNLCDVGVVSSVGSEAISRVTMEWMSVGKPVVGTKVGSIPEIIKEKITGFLVPPGDSDLMAQRIEFLLENKKRAQVMGKEGRKRIENVFTRDIFIKKMEEIYAEIIRGERVE